MSKKTNAKNLTVLMIAMAMIVTSAALSAYVLKDYLKDETVDDLAFTEWFNEKRSLFSDLDEQQDDEDDDIDDDSTRASGGQQEWKAVLFESEGEALSSPGLADLDNNGDLEIVVASSADYVYALKPNGGYYWDNPYNDDVIDYLGQTAQTSGLDFDPPPIFSSVITADVNLGDSPEVIIGVKDGALCLGSDGEKQWKKGLTTGFYFSTPCITDLEGDWTGEKEDLEIILASDDESYSGWIEAFEVDGGAIFREEAVAGPEGGLIGCSVVAADLDGDFYDGQELINPDPSKERDTELIIGNHDLPVRIFSRQGENSDGKPNYDEGNSPNSAKLFHQTYGTAGVANVTGGPGLEIITPTSNGWDRTWTGWWGTLYMFSETYERLWKYDIKTSGSPSSFFTSPAICDVHMARNDPGEITLDYECFVGSDNGLLYCVSPTYRSLMWTFDTGGRIMSSPAVCNINNDDELEVVVGSNSGKVFCLDGDPSDGIDEGVAYPGDGIGQDVLWVYDAENPIGISSPVIADIDLDGMLEVVIGDTEGNVHCISAGGRSLRGQEDWPQFHYDLNRTGYYNPQLSYGVDLYARRSDDGSRESLVKSVKPGATVSFNVTVENIGKGQSNLNKDTIFLSVEQDTIPEGWSVYLDTPPDKGNDDPGYVTLGSQETDDLVIYVTAPWEGELGEMAKINLTASSQKDEFAKDTISMIAILDLDLNFEINYLKQPDQDPLSDLYNVKWVSISPGSDTVVSVSIRNTGNVNDTYMISLPETPSGTEFNWYFVETGSRQAEIFLNSKMHVEQFGGTWGTTLNVNMEVPSDALSDVRLPLMIKGISVMSMDSLMEEIERTDTLVIDVGEYSEIQLRCDEPTMFINPNGTVNFQIQIYNNGNRDVLNVVLVIEGKQPGWTVTYPEEPVSVYQDQMKLVTLMVKAPGYSVAETRSVFKVIGMIEGSPHLRSTVSVTAIVNHVYSIETVTSPKDLVEVDPGIPKYFDLIVSNLGNGEDTVHMKPHEMGSEWKMDFFDNKDRSIFSKELLYKEVASIKVRILVPEDTRTGTYTVSINTSGGSSSHIAYVKVFVNQTYDLSIETLEGLSSVESEIRPMQEKNFVLKVENGGNGMEKVNIRLGAEYDHIRDSMEVLYDGWDGTFIAISNTPDFTTNIQTFDPIDPLPISNLVADVYYTPVADVGNSGTMEEFRDISVVLDKGHKAYVHLSLRAPRYEVQTDEGSQVQVSARGQGGPTDYDVASFRMNIRYPDLVFFREENGRGIEISGGSAGNGYDARAGDILTFIVRIHNTGDIPAENVDVQLLVDGEVMKTNSLKAVKNGGNDTDIKTVIFSWVVSPGTHKVEVIVDPEDSIVEIPGGEGESNMVSRTVKVQGNFILKEIVNENPIVSTMLIIFLAAVVLVSVSMILRKRK